MSENRILCLKPAPPLKWRGQDSQHETYQRNHNALTLGDSSANQYEFGTHSSILRPAFSASYQIFVDQGLPLPLQDLT